MKPNSLVISQHLCKACLPVGEQFWCPAWRLAGLVENTGGRDSSWSAAPRDAYRLEQRWGCKHWSRLLLLQPLERLRSSLLKCGAPQPPSCSEVGVGGGLHSASPCSALLKELSFHAWCSWKRRWWCGVPAASGCGLDVGLRGSGLCLCQAVFLCSIHPGDESQACSSAQEVVLRQQLLLCWVGSCALPCPCRARGRCSAGAAAALQAEAGAGLRTAGYAWSRAWTEKLLPCVAWQEPAEHGSVTGS